MSSGLAADVSPIASWKFDENIGTTAYDSSSNSNHGKINGATWTTGKIVNALSFDGINDYVDAGNPVSLQITGAISMEGWVKINDLSVSSSLFGRGHGLSSGNNGYFLSYYAKTKSLYFDTYSTTTRDALYKTNAIIDNNWHHVAVTWDGTTSANGKKLYIDGVMMAQKTSSIASMGNPSYNFRIGIDSTNDRPAKANIDEVKIFNRALLASEVLAHYNSGTIDTTAPIISAIAASNITSTSATISWTANEASNTQVEYGITDRYGTSTTLNTNSVTSHSQNLYVLTASTTYHFSVKSNDTAGNLAKSSDQIFTTQDLSGAISGTVIDANSKLAIQNSIVTDGTRSATTDQNGNYTISNVPPGTYSVTASASGDQSSTQSGITVKAILTSTVDFDLIPYIDIDSPNLTAISSSNINSTFATISWTTNEASDTRVEYGTTTSYGSATTLDSNMVTSHSRTLSGLTASNLYHYMVKSKDAAGNLATSADQTFTTSAPDSSLIASWKLDENAGRTAYDSSGNSNDGTIIGAIWTYGKMGSGLNFDGINDYIDAGNKADFQITGAISMEGWIKINDLSVTSSLFGRGHGLSSGNNGYFLSYYASTKSLYFDTYSTTTRDALYRANAIIDNNWHHIAVTWDGTTSSNGKKMYIDGVLVAQKTSSIASMGNPSYNFRIGMDSTNDRPAKANIDEVKIYNRALLASEIIADYNDGTIDTAVPAIEPDTTIPTIFSIRSSSITSPTATISWTTDESSDTQVEYGITTSYGISTELNTSLGTSHSQTFSGLTVSTLYHYRVKSKDAAGNLAISGDNTFTTSTSTKYGANANPTGNPIGGGKGYSKIISPSDSDYIVSTKTELLSALSRAVAGEIIYVSDSAQIDMTGEASIVIKGGVTLASGRGNGASTGGRIYTTSYPSAGLFRAGGANVRVTGITFTGANPTTAASASAHGIYTAYPGLEVDNSEISGWSFAAVYLDSNAYNAHIHHNYFHHNQREGTGYSIELAHGSNSAIIEANYFDYYRHTVAATGDITSTYEFRYNRLGSHTTDGAIDRHGLSGGNGGWAGYDTIIHHNTVEVTTDYAVSIRGQAYHEARVYNNWFYRATPNLAIEIMNYAGTRVNPGSNNNPMPNLYITDNWYGTTPPPNN
ncbi:MAG: carboxypeptidase regulatory-like domain-containing protein [Candidatus Methanoperedens sp.]|nr:carboxypeptidase regulatory-like domain-containing protein [Candidatus Methanoperedens sp.]